MAAQKNGEEAAQKGPATGTSRLEWGAAAVSATMLIATIGYMIFYDMTEPEGPAKIIFVQGQVEQTADGYVMKFIARNEGYATAAALGISGSLVAGGQVVEESEATIDYVPTKSEREGALFFTHDPRQHTMKLRSLGYSAP